MKADSPFYPKTVEILNQSHLFRWLDKAVIQDMLLFFERRTWLNKSIVMMPEQTTQWFCVLISRRKKNYSNISSDPISTALPILL